MVSGSLDNSDWMRNGDYAPSRIDAEQDAGAPLTSPCVSQLTISLAAMLCNDRLNSNPENTVGILTMAGKG